MNNPGDWFVEVGHIGYRMGWGLSLEHCYDGYSCLGEHMVRAVTEFRMGLRYNVTLVVHRRFAAFLSVVVHHRVAVVP